jgi:hypothetical protein
LAYALADTRSLRDRKRLSDIRLVLAPVVCRQPSRKPLAAGASSPAETLAYSTQAYGSVLAVADSPNQAACADQMSSLDAYLAPRQNLGRQTVRKEDFAQDIEDRCDAMDRNKRQKHHQTTLSGVAGLAAHNRTPGHCMNLEAVLGPTGTIFGEGVELIELSTAAVAFLSLAERCKACCPS